MGTVAAERSGRLPEQGEGVAEGTQGVAGPAPGAGQRTAVLMHAAARQATVVAGVADAAAARAGPGPAGLTRGRAEVEASGQHPAWHAESHAGEVEAALPPDAVELRAAQSGAELPGLARDLHGKAVARAALLVPRALFAVLQVLGTRHAATRLGVAALTLLAVPVVPTDILFPWLTPTAPRIADQVLAAAQIEAARHALLTHADGLRRVAALVVLAALRIRVASHTAPAALIASKPLAAAQIEAARHALLTHADGLGRVAALVVLAALRVRVATSHTAPAALIASKPLATAALDTARHAARSLADRLGRAAVMIVAALAARYATSLEALVSIARAVAGEPAIHGAAPALAVGPGGAVRVEPARRSRLGTTRVLSRLLGGPPRPGAPVPRAPRGPEHGPDQGQANDQGDRHCSQIPHGLIL